jgi:hypothetical protein
MTTQTMIQTVRSNLLCYSLEADGAFEITGGIILVAGARPLATLFGLDRPAILYGLGVAAILFGVWLIRYAAREPANRQVALIAATSNAAGFLLGMAGLALGWFPLTAAGKWALALIAEVVAFYAALEFYALWRTRPPVG